MQKIVLANQSNLRLGSSVLLKLNPIQQVTKVPSRQCSSILLKPLEGRVNVRARLVLSNRNAFDTRTFATTQSLNWFWNKKPAAEAPLEPMAETAAKDTSIPDAPQVQEPLATAADSAYNNTGYIPEPPAIIDETVILNALGEPSLQSLGLGSNFTPVGWVQQAIEFFHVSLGLPWYSSIVLFAVIMRTCLFPITIKSQQNAAKMKKIAPLTARLRDKINEAKMNGDSLKVARATNEYSQMMKSHNIGLGTMALPLLQFPVFISAFIGIRKMCNLPVESMTTGGMLWFENLAIADPTYVLPTLSVLSILAIVYRGIETGMELKNMTPIMKAGIFGMSAISFPFLIFMPAGIMVYFVTTNAISLGVSFIMNVNAVKKVFKIPIMSPNEMREVKEAGKKEKNFLSGFRESIQNQKIISEVKEREALRQRQFERAGTQVPVKTFKTNPKIKQ